MGTGRGGGRAASGRGLGRRTRQPTEGQWPWKTGSEACHRPSLGERGECRPWDFLPGDPGLPAPVPRPGAAPLPALRLPGPRAPLPSARLLGGVSVFMVACVLS